MQRPVECLKHCKYSRAPAPPRHISLDLNVRGCVKFDSILMRNVTKIGVSSSFGVLGSIKQKLIFLTQNQLHKVIFLESGKT